MKEYRTIEGESTASYEIQKSRFIAHAKHAENEQAARDFIAQQKKTYFDARHNCSAWVLGAMGDKQKSNDDGEPGGTAGNPILEAIKKKGLTDIVVVVTRYFGGIKLGAGGLIRAYGHTAILGLEAAKTVAMTPFLRAQLTCDYTLFQAIDNFLRKQGIRIEDTSYTDRVDLTVLLPPKQAEHLLGEITELTAGRCQHEMLETVSLPIPIHDA